MLWATTDPCESSELGSEIELSNFEDKFHVPKTGMSSQHTCICCSNALPSTDSGNPSGIVTHARKHQLDAEFPEQC